MHRNFRWIAGVVAMMLSGTLLAACGGAAPATEAPTAAPAAAPPRQGQAAGISR